MLDITKITLCWELFGQRVPQLHIADQLGIDRVTVYVGFRVFEETVILKGFWMNIFLLRKDNAKNVRLMDF